MLPGEDSCSTGLHWFNILHSFTALHCSIALRHAGAHSPSSKLLRVAETWSAAGVSWMVTVARVALRSCSLQAERLNGNATRNTTAAYKGLEARMDMAAWVRALPCPRCEGAICELHRLHCKFRPHLPCAHQPSKHTRPFSNQLQQPPPHKQGNALHYACAKRCVRPPGHKVADLPRIAVHCQVAQLYLGGTAAPAVRSTIEEHIQRLQADCLGQVGDGAAGRQQGVYLWGEVAEGEAAQGHLRRVFKAAQGEQGVG